ncbi:MAG: hypothetical protein AB1730_16470 [Myxococcota bacterium]|jgi:hypothetical protein
MKVEHPHSAGPAPRAAQPFKQLLAEAKQSQSKSKSAVPRGNNAVPPANPLPATAKPGPAAGKPAASMTGPTVTGPSVAAQATVARAAGAQRQVARQRVEAEAERLTTVRAGHHQAVARSESRSVETLASAAEKVDARVLALIVKELESAFEGEPPHVGRAANGDGQATPFRAEAPPPVKAAGPPARAEQAVALIERIETFVRSSRPALALTLNNSLGARVEIERLGPGRIALKLIGRQGPPSPDAVSRIREELRARGLQVGALSVA